MDHTEQLTWERKRAPYAAGAAAGAAVLTLVSGVVASSVLTSASNEGQYLTQLQHQATPWVLAGILQAIGLLFAPPALAYLYYVVKYRRSGLPQPAIVLAVAGAILSAVVAIWLRVAEVNAANDFAGPGAHPTRPPATI